MASSVPQKKVYHLPLQLDHNHPRARSLNLSPALHELRFTALERVLLAKLVMNPIITSICVTHFDPWVLNSDSRSTNCVWTASHQNTWGRTVLVDIHAEVKRSLLHCGDTKATYGTSTKVATTPASAVGPSTDSATLVLAPQTTVYQQPAVLLCLHSSLQHQPYTMQISATPYQSLGYTPAPTSSASKDCNLSEKKN